MDPVAGGKRCITLWYHMYGRGIGSLRLIIRDIKTKTEKVLKTVSGNQGDKWIKGETTFDANKQYKVIAL